MRTLSTAFRNSLEAPHSDEIPLIFLRITHPNLADIIRLANDVCDYVWTPPSPSTGQYTYIGFPFDITLLSDSDKAPSARLRVQNIDGKIGLAARMLVSSPRIQLDVLAASDFGVPIKNAAGKFTRTEPGTVPVEYSAPRMRLRNVRGDVMAVEGELWSWDLSQEPYPAIRTTQDKTPALYR